MGCGCGKSAQQTVKYVYTDETGRVTANLSETQAKAMQIRKGGGTVVSQTQ